MIEESPAMTVGLALTYLQQMSRDLRRFTDGREPIAQTDQPGLQALDLEESEAFRNKLLNTYRQIKELIAAFSQGYLAIRPEEGRTIDLYEQVCSGQYSKHELQWIKSDLDHIIATLSEEPPDQPLRLTIHRYHQTTNGPQSFGSLGHQEPKWEGPRPFTLQDILHKVEHFLHEHISQSEDQEDLQAHLHALLNHPAMTPVLSLPFPLRS